MSSREPAKMMVALPCMLCGQSVLQNANDKRVSAEIRAIEHYQQLLLSLERQTDNMAFLLNHAGVPDGWYERFTRELQEDRAALSQVKSEEEA